MALIVCPGCLKPISDQVVLCPGCDRVIDDATRVNATRLRNFLIAAVIVGAGLLAIRMFTMPKSERSLAPYDPTVTMTDVQKRHYRSCTFTRSALSDAESMAKEMVRRELKAPSTASFVEVNSKYNMDCEFTVVGKLDAQNSFGAMLRGDFSVHLKYHPESDGWQRLSYNIRNP